MFKGVGSIRTNTVLTLTGAALTSQIKTGTSKYRSNLWDRQL